VLSRLAAIETAAADFRVLGVPVSSASRRDETETEVAESAFDRATRRLRQAWRDLFSYSRVDPAHSRLVTREDEALRRQQFELQLFAARIAAMQQDRQGYAQALQSATALLDRSFDARDATVSAARNELALLAAIDVNPAVPEIGTAAQLLQRVIRASPPAKP
jgi:uncharacterized protein HemX